MEIVKDLLAFELQLHLLHLNSTSYAKHVALGELYATYGAWVDNFVESLSGSEDELVASSIDKIEVDNTIKNPVAALENFYDDVLMRLKSQFNQEDWLLNDVQTIEQSILKTLYKLKFLN